jgi:hypothetical protein
MTQQVLRWIGFVMTIAPGLVIAARVKPRLVDWAAIDLTAGHTSGPSDLPRH